MQTKSRNYTIDLVRLIASFCVIALHVDLGIANNDTIALIRLACRWAVPFFFLVSGYFYQPHFAKDPTRALIKNCSRLLKVFVITSLIFWPISYARTGELFKFSYLQDGTHLHLWFLPSMILGFVFLYFLSLLHPSDKIILGVAFLFMAFVLFKDSYANLVPGLSAIPNHHKRILLSIPCLCFGMYIRKREDLFVRYVNWKIGTLLVVLGYGLQIIEAYFLKSIKDYPITAHQFLIGTFYMSMGVFIISLTARSGKSKLSNWGESYSLLIYLYHPLLIISAMSLFQTTTPFLQAPLVFVLTLLMVSLIHKYLPRLFNFLSGNFTLPLENRFLLRQKPMS
ncbi:acyltransferase [Spirosoma endophyticum]|uniref:Surface polysaccharide O-acyltransferase, integral membrane enzyme n=1 Tax=Spirosoma endophyticum TaxID=662367 RepID=A0A1I1PUG7_9BACT|nr:acyltransferase [Spirosoma endophyticum]SFD13337.1 Surface polysaccharide O-acyltransferase, integral membrane enzyme [Spirosoma endophyticum]